jgi:hypothetical protein
MPKYKFATTTNLTTSYVGEAAMEYIHKAFLSSKTIADGLVTIKEDVHKSWKIRRIASSGLIADQTCDFTPVGTVDLDERALDTSDLEVNLEMCKDDFLGDWGSVRMGSGANKKQLPPETAEGMINEILLTVGEEVERLIWDATIAGTDPFDGLTEIILNAATSVKITGVPIVAGNVIAQLQLSYDALSGLKIYNKPDVSMYVSRNVGAAYQSALGLVGAGVGYSNLATVGLKPWDFLGVPIQVMPGIRPSTVITGQKSNLFFGTDSLSDTAEVILKDMSDVDLSNNVRFRAGFAAGVQYGWADELIIQEPTIP